MKPFNEITTDAEYLRAVGMGPKRDQDGFLWNSPWWYYDDACGEYVCIAKLHLDDDQIIGKWNKLIAVLCVLGPEADRRKWELSIGPSIVHVNPDDDACVESIINKSIHLALLEAFYNAHHAQGDKQ